MPKLPPELESIVQNLTSFQRTYCEYRSRGLSQSVSAEKAGSQASNRETLGRTGYQVEQVAGVKEYINYLKEEKAEVFPIDELEIVSKLRDVYREAMEAGKYKDANVALEMMGTIIGIFGHGKTGPKPNKETFNNTDPFRDEGREQEAVGVRVAKLQSMVKDLEVHSNDL